jgi:hypothetical protein
LAQVDAEDSVDSLIDNMWMSKANLAAPFRDWDSKYACVV